MTASRSRVRIWMLMALVLPVAFLSAWLRHYEFAEIQAASWASIRALGWLLACIGAYLVVFGIPLAVVAYVTPPHKLERRLHIWFLVTLLVHGAGLVAAMILRSFS